MTATPSGVIVDDLVLAELERLAGVPDERGDVGAEEVLAVAEADDERAVAAGADDDAGLVGVHREQREGARRGRLTTARIASVRSLDSRSYARREQVGGDLGVGLGRELDAVGQQLGLERVEVLDDAVVDQRELAVLAAAVRVGVGSVGPPWVAQRVCPMPVARRRQRLGVELRDEVGQLAGLLAGRDAAAVDQRDAGRVVAAVLQPGAGPP